jgi:hypothetical protein
MNRIRVTNKEMLDIIYNNGIIEEEAPELLQHIYDNGFIFNAFTLIWENTYTYKVRIEGTGADQIIYVKKIYETKSGKHEHTNIEFTLDDYIDNIAEFFSNYKGGKIKYTREILDDTWSADYLPVISFMQYVIHAAKNQEVIYKDHAERKYKSSGKKSKPKEEFKLIEIIRRYAVHINHSKRTITCDHWEVKGHFRHYKNGKVSYVKPYSKGKNKAAAPVSRTYHL